MAGWHNAGTTQLSTGAHNTFTGDSYTRTDTHTHTRVATKIFEGFGEALYLLWVGNLHQSSTSLGQEPASIVHYTRPGNCIHCPLN